MLLNILKCKNNFTSRAFGMKKSKLAICIIFPMLFATYDSLLFADRYSESDVTKFLSEVEMKISEIHKSGAENFASEEIHRTIQFTARAKKLLSSNEHDLAYYELKKAAAHFRLISAKKRLYHAENDFYHVKKIVTP